MSALWVGQKVVCVDDTVDPAWLHRAAGFDWVGELDGLKKGSIYTVRSMFVDPDDGMNCLRVEEIIRSPSLDESCEPGYVVGRFRPAVSVPEDVALFTHHLAGGVVAA